jgi:hypothetical protein
MSPSLEESSLPKSGLIYGFLHFVGEIDIFEFLKIVSMHAPVTSLDKGIGPYTVRNAKSLLQNR